MIPMIECKSSLICAYGYDEATQTLALQFYRWKKGARVPGSIYHYANFTPVDYAHFCAVANDKRTENRPLLYGHFATYIKSCPDRYPFTKQPEETKEEA